MSDEEDPEVVRKRDVALEKSLPQQDSGKYRRLSEPFNDLDEANAALGTFFSKISQLREELGISDVVVLVEVPVAHADGGERRCSARMHLGDSQNELPMVARDYGSCRERHEALIASAIETGRREARKRQR